MLSLPDHPHLLFPESLASLLPEPILGWCHLPPHRVYPSLHYQHSALQRLLCCCWITMKSSTQSFSTSVHCSCVVSSQPCSELVLSLERDLQQFMLHGSKHARVTNNCIGTVSLTEFLWDVGQLNTSTCLLDIFSAGFYKG